MDLLAAVSATGAVFWIGVLIVLASLAGALWAGIHQLWIACLLCLCVAIIAAALLL